MPRLLLASVVALSPAHPPRERIANPDRRVHRRRQDHRPHHHLRRLYQRNRAVRRAAGHAARLLFAREGTEEPKTDSFVEVDEITLDRKIRRIFTGWMFAESPGLNAVEHAVYDVWLKSCKRVLRRAGCRKRRKTN